MTDFSYTAILPTALRCDLENFVACLPKRKRRYVDWYYFLIDTITRRLIVEHKGCLIRGMRVTVNHWHCPLQATFLNISMGHVYLDIIADLVDAGFIGRGKSYILTRNSSYGRGRSKAFWLNSKYSEQLCTYLNMKNSSHGTKMKRESVLCKHEITSEHMLKRIYSAKSAMKYSMMMDKDISEYYEHLQHFRVNAEKASKVLNHLVETGVIDEHKRALEMQKVNRFGSVGVDPIALYVKRDPYGRIHTNVTTMKREVRDNCITCDGEPVGGVDIKSSQASFLSKIFEQWVNLASDTTFVPQTKFVKIEPYWCDENERVRAQGFLKDEYDRYVGLLKAGQIYEYFAKEAGEDSDIDREVTRNEAKKEFLAMLFDRVEINETRNPLRGAIRRVWRDRFPHLLICLDRMKRMNHAALAYEMQRTESNFVFNVVIPKVTRDIGCHYCTVHDSVIVPREHVDAVKKIMDGELSRLSIPTITKEEFDTLFDTPETIIDRTNVESEMDSYFSQNQMN